MKRFEVHRGADAGGRLKVFVGVNSGAHGSSMWLKPRASCRKIFADVEKCVLTAGLSLLLSGIVPLRLDFPSTSERD